MGEAQMFELVEVREDFAPIESWLELAHRMEAAKMPFRAVSELVRAFEHGVAKHGAGNWTDYRIMAGGLGSTLGQHELKSKATRHFAEVVRSGWSATDEESGVLHAAKEAANMLIGAELWGCK